MKFIYFSVIISIVLFSFNSCASSKISEDHSDVEVILKAKRAGDYLGTGPLGAKSNPIKCEGSSGAKSYLNSLKGPLNEKITWEEVGSGGISPFGGVAIIYTIKVVSVNAGNPIQLYFDTTFDDYVEPKAASGFSK